MDNWFIICRKNSIKVSFTLDKQALAFWEKETTSPCFLPRFLFIYLFFFFWGGGGGGGGGMLRELSVTKRHITNSYAAMFLGTCYFVFA